MSEQAKYTPGSWGVEDPMDHCLTIVANPDAPVYKWIWVATCDWPDEDNHAITSEEVKANAQLIAAAPDLLEALTRIREYVATVRAPSPGTVLDWCDTAIAKAEGR